MTCKNTQPFAYLEDIQEFLSILYVYLFIYILPFFLLHANYLTQLNSVQDCIKAFERRTPYCMQCFGFVPSCILIITPQHPRLALNTKTDTVVTVIKTSFILSSYNSQIHIRLFQQNGCKQEICQLKKIISEL